MNQPQPVSGETVLSVSLRAQMWNEVFAAMGKAPYENVQPLISVIMEQLNSQAQQQIQPQMPMTNGLDPHPSVS